MKIRTILLLIALILSNGIWYVKYTVDLGKSHEQIRLMRCRSLLGLEDEQDVPVGSSCQ